jgi:hypothetical protein
MIDFPAKICYLNNDEVKIVKDMNEIEKYRGFVVQQVNMAWGRKIHFINFADQWEEYEKTLQCNR